MKVFLKTPSPIHHLLFIFRSLFWFFIGMILGFFFLISFAFIIFQHFYGENVYPGITIENSNLGGKTEKDVKNYFVNKNTHIQNTSITFTYNNDSATISAKQLQIGYDSNLLARQAYSIGRSADIFSNITLVFLAYVNGIHLQAAYTYSPDQLVYQLSPLIQKAHEDPIDAAFSLQNGRVSAFRLSTDGQDVDTDALEKNLSTKISYLLVVNKQESLTMQIPIKKVKPKISSNDANKLGIQELIGTGTSLYHYSIDSRKYNVGLAASRVNGVLVAPDETFSFDKAVGDISNLTGYKQAYVIQNGKTVLGDGGGVCQVSTTLFRAMLNAGLPITERHAHAYRVEYYEEDSLPGIDATIYAPTVDLKFKNDTGSYILIQAVNDPVEERLTFYLYGKRDGRITTVGKPVITSETPPPPAVYQDDPTLPKGTVKQIDFAAGGTNVYFTRQVVKNGKMTINETYNSNYQPWAAVYLRGPQ